MNKSIVNQIHELPLSDYERGYVAGLQTYAYMNSGVYYVGTTGRTLDLAIRCFLDSRGYFKEIDGVTPMLERK